LQALATAPKLPSRNDSAISLLPTAMRRSGVAASSNEAHERVATESQIR
jgi:hypothetical protein